GRAFRRRSRSRPSRGSGPGGLGLDRDADARVFAALGGQSVGGVVLGKRVVLDDVAAHHIAAGTHLGTAEQGRGLVATVVLDAFGLALYVFVYALTLLPEVRQFPLGGSRDTGLEAVRALY